MDTNRHESVSAIADQTGIDVVLPEGLVGRTTIRLHDVTWPFSRTIWGFEVLAFGLLGLPAYWLIYHSRLSSRRADPTQG